MTPKGVLGSSAADFNLLGVDDNQYNLSNTRGENGLLVMFLCNHCPYVQKIIREIIEDVKTLSNHNIRSVAIMPNDVTRYPQDSLKNMRAFSKQKKFSFPYLIDHEQVTARSYKAVCTPDFFGFDKELKLIYRGRLRGLNNERELHDAMILPANNNIESQHPGEGCSIKWIIND